MKNIRLVIYNRKWAYNKKFFLLYAHFVFSAVFCYIFISSKSFIYHDHKFFPTCFLSSKTSNFILKNAMISCQISSWKKRISA